MENAICQCQPKIEMSPPKLLGRGVKWGLMELTEEFIQDQTTPDYYDRGLDYYHQGRVKDFRESEDLITAQVSGTEDYKITIDLTTLDYHCDCFAYERDRLCKHLVATLLTKVHGIISKPTKKTKNTPKALTKKPTIKSDDILKPNELKQELKRMLSHLDRYQGNYWVYVDEQQRILNAVSNRMNHLDDLRENSDELLKTASWLDEELTHYDDSDGVLQEAILEIVSKAVRFLENSQSISDLAIIYKYTAQGHKFDLGSDIVRLIFEEVENPLIINSLGLEIELAMENKSQSFAFNPRHALVSWSEYLKSRDSDHFELLAKKYYPGNIDLTKQLVEFYLEKSRYSDVISIAWPQRHHYMLDRFLETALEKAGVKDKLILFYQENSADHLDQESLRKLKEIYIQNDQRAEWDKYSENLLAKLPDNHDRVDLLMMLKRYVEAAELLGKMEFWSEQISITDYAKKLAILDKQAGVIIYRSLLEKETIKMVTSNFYPRLMGYLDKLLSLGDKVYLQKFVTEMQKKYPTKKTLQSLLASKKI